MKDKIRRNNRRRLHCDRSEHWRLRPVAAAVLIACGAAPFPALHGYAAPPLPPGTLPVPQANWVSSGQATSTLTANALTINQTSAKAVLNWQSFNIANGSSVRFVQPDATSASLNRIHDANPSVIQGQLSANGQVYLINQNGIIFDKGAQINVGSLVGSTLNITDELFENGILTNARPSQIPAFSAFPNGAPSGMVTVENGAQIRTARGGRVMLLAPAVSNNGIISTPDGQTILAAGEKVYLAVSNDSSLRGLLVEVDNGGSAQNLNLGQIVAERGNATMIGLAVNQSGRVQATTSVNVNGTIRLLARDTVVDRNLAGGVVVPEGSRYGTLTLGEGSVTEVRPDLADRQTIKDSQVFNPSRIDIAGKTVVLQRNSAVVAPGGNIFLTAQSGFDFQAPGQAAAEGVRIYVAEGSIIDASGSSGVEVSAARNSIAVELRGNELRDSPLQRDGVLRGETVYVDARKGTPLADISGYLDQIERGVGERTTVGGSVSLKSEGDVVLRQGSTVDISGGSVRYLDGQVRTTKLLSQGRVVDISRATPDRIYDGLADSFTVTHTKWGVSETFVSPFAYTFTPGYTEGKNAGTLSILSHGLVLDGALIGKTTSGPYQRNAGAMPLGGKLVIGDASQVGEPVPDFRTAAVAFVERATPLPALFSFDQTLPQSFAESTQLSTSVFREGGFNRVAVYSNGSITLPAGVPVVLAPAVGTNANGSRESSSLTLNGRSIDLDGTILAPAASIALNTYDTFGTFADRSAYGVVLGSTARIDVKGQWVNDLPGLNGGSSTAPLPIDAGSVRIHSAADLVVAAGSVIDVSAGGHVGTDRKFAAGTAGTIVLATGRLRLASGDRQDSTLTLGGMLIGYGLTLGGAVPGGALSISGSKVAIGTSATVPGQLSLSPEFFEAGGFTQFNINGQDGLQLTDGTILSPAAAVHVADARYISTPTAGQTERFSTIALPALEQRTPTSVTLTANSKVFGDITIGKDAAIHVDPTASINIVAGNQITAYGTLEARAGKITLATLDPTQDDSYAPGQSIWLAPTARLVASGYLRPVVDPRGLRSGDVLPGGTVTISAGRGYVISEAGSLIDVSGTAAVLDIAQSGGVAPARLPTLVAGDAGAIVISAQEGMLLDGGWVAQPGGARARGGSLALTLDARVSSNISYPSGPSSLILSDMRGFVPGGLRPGQVVDPNAFDPVRSTLSHRGFVSSAALNAGGFDQISFKSPDYVVFGGDVSILARRSISVDALALTAQSDATVHIQAPYVSLASTTGFTPKAVAPGNGHLQVDARLIDLEGAIVLQGFADTHLASQGDIRLKGVFIEGGPATLAGSLTSQGDITLAANQVYPTSMADFRIEVRDKPDGTITILPGTGDSPVFSAGGKLTLSAPNIDQRGVLKAPFGQLVLDATQTLTLADGSRTSVSGDGQRVLLGRTDLSGNDYVYLLSSSTRELLTSLPEKRVDLNAPAVRIDRDAKVDLSGGGDLLAYEFTPGPGGSRDVLDPANSPNTFAILPGFRSQFAPYDHQEYLSGTTPALTPGDQVYLSGASGLAAGTYTLLPARYAMLPGAYLVTSVPGKVDFLPTQNYRLADGGQVVSGYRSAIGMNGQSIGDARTSAFLVRSGTYARRQSEYLATSAGAFFSKSGAGLLPRDAGSLSVLVTNSLEFDGTVVARRVASGKGARIDLSAPRITVVDTRGPDDGSVQIETGVLNRMAVESLLLGGTRSSTGTGWLVTPSATEVVVRNDGGPALVSSEVVLVATDRVQIQSGARIEAVGPQRVGDNLSFAPASDGSVVQSALVRVSSADSASIARAGGSNLGAGGTVDIGAGAVLTGRSLDLDATRDTLIATSAGLSAGAVSLAAGHINLGEVPIDTAGLTLTGALAEQLQQVSVLKIRSYSTLDLYGNAVLGAIDPTSNRPTLTTLGIESAGISGIDNVGKTAIINAGTVRFSNPSGLASTAAARGDGALQINAGSIEFADGAKTVTGFSSVTATASTGIVFSGQGSLSTQADTTLDAPRITATARANQTLDTGRGTLTIQAAGTTPDTGNPAPAALLALTARNIRSSGVVDLQGGHVTLSATGTDPGDGVTLESGSRIVAGGFSKILGEVRSYGAAGSVTLSANAGSINVLAGSSIDLAGAPGGGDGGTLALTAPQGQVVVAGTLRGGANSAYRSGRASIDSRQLDNFADLNLALQAGGFGDSLELRARSGDITISAADRVSAHQINISADSGAIRIDGVLYASGPQAGRIQVSAGNDLIASSTAQLFASSNADGAAGGNVQLATSGGTLSLLSGSSVDVRGGIGGKGGVLLMRAPRTTANDVAVGGVAATISGASEVVAEAVKVYSDISSIGTVSGPGSLTVATVADDNAALMANASAIQSRLGWTGPQFHVRPGIEVRSSGDLTVTTDWNLYSASRPGNEPGVLTLRATGSLYLNGSLSDGFDTALPSGVLQSGQSWSYRLLAGADMGAAAISAARPLDQLQSMNSGDVVLAAGKLVRTGTGRIEIAAGRDLRLESAASVVYTAGLPGPDVPGFVRPRVQELENGRVVFNINPVYPTDGGDVFLSAQRDIVGVPGQQLINDWLYRRTGGLASPTSYAYVNPQTTWWPRFNMFQEGVGALGGGNVTVAAGRDVVNVSVVVPTNGRLGGDVGAAPNLANLVVQGGGNIDVESGRDILSGVFYVARGTGRLTAQGRILSGYSAASTDGGSVPVHTVLAVGDGGFKISAGLDVEIETVFNPTLVRQFTTPPSRALSQQASFSTYGDGSSVGITSSAGGVRLFNNEGSALTLTAPQIFGRDGNTNLDGITLYPGTLKVAALGGDIDIRAPLNLYPAADGNLQILAAGSVLVGGTLNMLDTAPSRFPLIVSPVPNLTESVFLSPGRPDSAIIAHSDPPLHRYDRVPVEIAADTGDVVVANLTSISLPKRAEIMAGRDLRDLNLAVQNLNPDDVTRLTAGRDLVFASPRRASGAQETNTSAIQIGGPGRLEVLAGRDVDLGTSSGLISRGNLDNPFLSATGTSLVVMAGLGTNDEGKVRLPDSRSLYVNVRVEEFRATLPTGLPAAEVALLLDTKRSELDAEFNGLTLDEQTAAARETLFSELKHAGRAFATVGNYDQGYRAIDWLFPSTDASGKALSYHGDVKLFFSQIKTEQGGDIQILAPGGLVNAGLANPGALTKDSAQLGLITVNGGSIRSFTRGDFLVNQSRVFTLGGGDILLWSSIGNIDAGKGAKTVSATPPPQLKIDANGNFSLDITQSTQGSGIGVLLAKAGLVPGDVDLIAPRGEVNAGDAGIRVAGNLNIAALRVVGADNISVGGVSTGVPVAPTTNLSGLATGAGNVAADAAKTAEQVTQSLGSNAATVAKSSMPSFITVEVIGVGDEEGERR